MIKITGEELPNIPWQEKPEGCHDVVWRYSGNPIIERDAIPSSNSIFNSAVVPFEGKFAIYYGCADTVTGLAFAKADELISYIKENSL